MQQQQLNTNCFKIRSDAANQRTSTDPSFASTVTVLVLHTVHKILI